MGFSSLFFTWALIAQHSPGQVSVDTYQYGNGNYLLEFDDSIRGETQRYAFMKSTNGFWVRNPDSDWDDYSSQFDVVNRSRVQIPRALAFDVLDDLDIAVRDGTETKTVDLNNWISRRATESRAAYNPQGFDPHRLIEPLFKSSAAASFFMATIVLPRLTEFPAGQAWESAPMPYKLTYGLGIAAMSAASIFGPSLSWVALAQSRRFGPGVLRASQTGAFQNFYMRTAMTTAAMGTTAYFCAGLLKAIAGHP